MSSSEISAVQWTKPVREGDYEKELRAKARANVARLMVARGEDSSAISETLDMLGLLHEEGSVVDG